jgi:geranylgeranylglycerol-phosphate geranylgeranyltransferase
MLARFGNVFMAALGTLAGGYAVSRSPSLWPLALAMLGTMLGVAGGNAINDARDAEIDKRAHPNRPIPRGDLRVKDAVVAGWLLLGAAVLVLAGTGSAATLVLGVLFVLGLAWYEYRLKPMGLSGNIAISVIVGGTFLLGATAVTSTGPRVVERLFPHVGWTPLTFGILAALTTLAREIFKDLQDQEFDAAWRETLPLKMGARTAFTLARLFLLLGIFFGLLPAALHYFDRTYLVLIVPALSVFAVTVFVTEAGRAAFWTKMGMLLALIAFVATGLVASPF